MKTTANDETTKHFCAMCFATESDGSWAHTTVPEANYCTNCGASKTLVPIPAWAVASIRSQASWVGKRFYPVDEDRKTRKELAMLREIAGDPHCRTAEPARTPGEWVVRQPINGGHMVMWFKASDAAGALRAARQVMPYPTDDE